MNLLQQINEHMNEQQMFEQQSTIKISRMLEGTKLTNEILTEAITNWLAKLRGVVAKETMKPQEKQPAAEILGAVIALTQPGIASAFNDRNDIGTVLNLAAGQNKDMSRAALKRLQNIGNHESVAQYTEEALEALDDITKLTELTKRVQIKIDQLMRRNLAKEQKMSGDTDFSMHKDMRQSNQQDELDRVSFS
jgi:hypothetical protein